MNNKILFSLITLLLLHQTSEVIALSKQNARYASGALGVVSFFLSKNIVRNVGLNAITGVLSGLASYYILHQYTPQGRVAAAESILQKINQYDLATKKFETSEDFFNHVSKKYITNDLPLVDAHQDLTYLISEGQLALVLLQQAMQDGKDDFELMQRCQALQPQLYKMLANMTEAITRIREQEGYIKQMRIYHERQHLEVHKRIAAAQEKMAEH